MADEVQYASGPGSATNKRKYGDQTPPPPSYSTRHVTGFSGPIASQSPDSGHAPSSYNSVPPPVDDFQIVKQRCQEIAARLFNNVEAKRPRVENGGGGFDSNDNSGQKHMFSNMAPLCIPVSYGQPGTSKKMDADRMVELMGTPEQIAKAEQLINETLAEVEAEIGGSGTVSRRLTGHQAGGEQFVQNLRGFMILAKGDLQREKFIGMSGVGKELLEVKIGSTRGLFPPW